MNNSTNAPALRPLTSVDGFKRFLCNYHDRLHQEKGFPPLGRSKALQVAAHALGYTAWQAIRANQEGDRGVSDAAMKESYALVVYQADVDDRYSARDFQGPMMFDSARDCLDALLGEAESVVDWGDPVDLPEEVVASAAARGVNLNGKGEAREDWQWIREHLTPGEKVQVIDWYFDLLDGQEDTVAGYRITRRQAGQKGQGEDLEAPALAECVGSSKSQPKAKAAGHYTVWYYEAPRMDGNAMNCIVGPKEFRFAVDCLAELMAFVSSRAGDAIDGDEFSQAHADMIKAHGMDPEVFMVDGDPEAWDRLFTNLSPNEQAQVIGWVFDFLNDDLVCAEYHVRYHAPGEEGEGKIVTLDELAREN